MASDPRIPEPTSIAPHDIGAAIAALGKEPTRCLVCPAERPKPLFRRSGKRFWICRSCELVFVHDIYPEFVQDDDTLAQDYEFGTLRKAKPRALRKWDELLNELEPQLETGRLLEVGCGQGLFLEHARARGWEVTGVDLLEPLAALARTERGLDARTGELADAALPSGTFDVVYSSEVIEHVIDPIALLREMYRVLRPGGLAVLLTGNARSWSSRVRGGSWSYYEFKTHGHIRFFNPKAARALATAAGFAGVETRTRGFALREAGEMRGRWYKPLVQSAQAVLSPFAGPLHAGHRLRMDFRR